LKTFAGASTDYSHIIFEANDCLTSDAPCGGVNNLYEATAGKVSLVGYLPDSTVAQGSQPGNGEGAALQSYGQGPTGEFAQDISNAISADGSRIFFDAPADGGPPDPAQSGLTELYERVNGSSTVEISAVAAGATPANSTPEPATYWGAATDGSLVFLTSPAELTTDANTGTANAGNDLYEFDTATGSLSDLTVDTSQADSATGANVQGVVGTSRDGSYVYFVADGVLASGATPGDCAPQPGSSGPTWPPGQTCGLYVRHDGATRFIATLSSGDFSDWVSRRVDLQSYLTPDGRHLAFTSTMPLTGYDNIGATEVFEYSADTGQLVCASCDPTGAEPVGNAYIQLSQLATASSPFYQPRALSDDGSRLFFASPDALTPGAVSPYYKVYEYEHGSVSLIGAAGSGDDFFIDASASGNDVFIATRDQLVPSDQDQLLDVYDARVDGGLPAPTTPTSCSGDACQGAPTASSSLPVAATVSFTGSGNPAAATLITGRVKVLRHRVSGEAFPLTLRVPAPGTVALSGGWVKGVRRTVSHAGAYRVTVRLTAVGRRALIRRGRLAVTVEVRYQPTGGAASTATVRATFATHLHARRRTRRAAADAAHLIARRPR
jgi:hypothetical protein